MPPPSPSTIMPTSSIPSQSKSHPSRTSLSLSLSLDSNSSSTPKPDSSSPNEPSYLDDPPPDPSQSAHVAPSTIRNTVSQTTAKTSATPASQASRPSIDDGGSGSEIEMGPVTGHRRRHSSLMSSAGQSSNTRSHSRGQSLRIPQSPLRDEPKITEEGEEDEGSNLGKDDSGSEFLSDEDLHDDEETGLTNKDRRRRQKKRENNTRLDQRIAKEKNLSPDEQKEADQDVMKSLAVNGTLILLWYFFSLSISLVRYPPLSNCFPLPSLKLT